MSPWIRTAVKVGVWVFEAIRTEVRQASEPKSQPWPYRNVKLKNDATHVPDAHKVRTPKR